MKKPDKALECFEQALKINSDNMDAMNYKGVALKHMEEFEASINIFKTIVEAEPENPWAWLPDWFEL